MNRTRSFAAFRRSGGEFRATFAAALVFTAIGWAADPPWKSKPYQKWDDNDIHKVLFDSPWVHVAQVSAKWRQAGDETTGLPAGSVPPAGNPNGSVPAGPPSSGISGLSTAGVGSQRGEYPVAQYFVDWVSSKTMRAALAQRDVLHAGKAASEAEQYVSQVQPDYVILIQGADMAPFVRTDEKFFQANAFLQLKVSGQKVSPERVEYQRGPDGKSLAGALFFFPKKLPSGDPLIQPGEKSIEFVCKLEESTLKTSFEPQKMVTPSGLDL
jgi:hypothetical protein